MMKQLYLRRVTSLFAITIALSFAFNVPAVAQKKDYKPGEKIEYKSWGYPETWEEATFLRATPDGSQPMIRRKPNEFQKDGWEMAASWADIRLLSAKSNKAPVVTNQNENPANETGTDNNGTTSETTTDFGTGLMTKEQVLSFLQTKLGDNSFQNPRRVEISKELGEMIKARGLDFRYSSSLADFQSKLRNYAGWSEFLVFPLRDNYGEPTKQSWLMGAWNLGKIGAAVDYVKNNRVYRQGEIGVGNIGTLSLNANGTYLWKSVLKTQPASGKWRNATKVEMSTQGGDGIVLLKAQDAYDWLVTKNRATTLNGEWIYISELGTRQINEYGSRGGK